MARACSSNSRRRPRSQTGFILHTSNRLENLATDLAQVFANPLAAPLTPEIVIVQSHGMERWLSQQLADRRGICANVNFFFPQKFFARLVAEVLPQSAEGSFYERDAMTWRIIDLLPRFQERPEFAPVAKFLRGANTDLRAFQLARRIGQVFDQYLVFRPQMIRRWDAGEGDDWQAVLWCELGKSTASREQHLAALAQQLITALPRAKNLPTRVIVFGVSTLPPLYVQLFAHLATHVPVHAFLLQPTAEWWGDVQTERERLRRPQLDLFSPPAEEENETANPLLAENSKLGRDFLHLLFDAGEVQQNESFTVPPRDNALGILQRDILAFERKTGAAKLPLSPEDRSLQFHSCHNVTRELEVLHDQLLALFDHDPTLLPKDVVVMMPDVSVYASHIDAIFAVPEKKPDQFIPYSIADRAARAASGVIDSFLRLLELLPGRFRASDVFALLETPPVQRRFALAPADLAKIQRWTMATGARWGIDAEHRAHLGLPVFSDNSWRQAIDRMLLGYALTPGENNLFAGILPFDQIEGSNAEIAGQFIDFLERLFLRAHDFDRPRPLSRWADALADVLEEFIKAESSDERELSQLRGSIARLQEIADITGNNRPAPLLTIVPQLEESLNDARRGAGFLNGTVTFCSLKLMRSVPFRVVCLLGLNDTAYPRRNHAPSFDLIAQKPKRGDRTARADDRALFLEALLSARDFFCVSYLGRSLRDNKPLPPSVLVSELIDYAQQRFQSPHESFVVEHALQAFSAQNFDGHDPRVFSYSADNLRAAEVRRSDREECPLFCPEPIPDDAPKEISLAALENFFANPAKYFLRERLQVRLPKDEEAFADEEPFALDYLDGYILNQSLLERAVRGDDLRAARAGTRAQGILPPGESGEKIFAQALTSARDFANAISALTAHTPEPPLEVAQMIGNRRFTGAIDEIRNGVLLRARLAKFKTKDFMRAWLRHLTRNLVQSGATHLFGFDQGILAHRFAPITPEVARQHLENLFAFYLRGRREPLRFFPETSWKFVTVLKDKDADNARRAAQKVWETEGGAKARDEFLALIVGDEENALDVDWESTSRGILEPLLAGMEKLP